MQLGVLLDSQAFNIWSTVLAVLLVIIWLANAGGTVLGIANGKLLGLDRGWRAQYYVSSAENEKDQQQQSEQNGRSHQNGSIDNLAGPSNGTRNRDP